MLKALIKKQLLELNSFYFTNRKTGKRRSKLSASLLIGVFVLLFVYLGVVFYGVGRMFVPLLLLDNDWLYFSLMGIMAILFGVLGTAFNTAAGLYHAKDNDLLLSMPIKPYKIIISRVVGVCAFGWLFESVIMIPALIVRFTVVKVYPLTVVCSVITYLIMAVLITALSCLLGFLVAVISAKFKNKSFVTVILSLAFIVAYYYFFSKATGILGSLVAKNEKVAKSIKGWLYPFYLLGNGAEGNVVSLLLFFGITLLLLLIVAFLLSKTFTGIATKSETNDKKTYSDKSIKVSGLEATLLKKEFKHYIGSAVYMLNCSLGTFVVPVMAVCAVIWKQKLREVIYMSGIKSGFIPIIALTIVIAVLSMNDLTAPSISLEGKNLWILKSMPVDTRKIFRSKINMQLILTTPVAVLLTVCMAFVLDLNFSTAVYMVCAIIVYTFLWAHFGLFVNLKMPNLEWTNEVIPIKQSLSVIIVLLGGFGVAVSFALGGYFAIKIMSAETYILAVLVLFAILSRVINTWLDKNGVEIFKNL